jgi:hypothetical protein
MCVWIGAAPLPHLGFLFISYLTCVCMHAHTEHHAMSAMQSTSSDALSKIGLSVKHAAMEQQHERYCRTTIVPMMQLSHLVFWMPSLSWIIQRVACTESAKQKHACMDQSHVQRCSGGKK